MKFAVAMLNGSASYSNPPPPRPQLRCVFDACDTTGSGLISLRQLANVSRSHVNGATQVLANSKFLLQTERAQIDALAQVEQILDIFDIGEDRAEDDQLDFSQFHSKVCCSN